MHMHGLVISFFIPLSDFVLVTVSILVRLDKAEFKFVGEIRKIPSANRSKLVVLQQERSSFFTIFARNFANFLQHENLDRLGDVLSSVCYKGIRRE